MTRNPYNRTKKRAQSKKARRRKQREQAPVADRGLHRQLFQYVIQCGLPPAVSYYSVSPSYFEDKAAAHRAAIAECERKGLKWNENMIHIRRARDAIKHTTVISSKALKRG